MCGCLSSGPYWGPGPQPRPCALTGNPTSNPLVHRLVLNPLSHSSRGSAGILRAEAGGIHPCLPSLRTVPSPKQVLREEARAHLCGAAFRALLGLLWVPSTFAFIVLFLKKKKNSPYIIFYNCICIKTNAIHTGFTIVICIFSSMLKEFKTETFSWAPGRVPTIS